MGKHGHMLFGKWKKTMWEKKTAKDKQAHNPCALGAH